ncbi:uncharacterized protein LOC143275410 [Babylonia areolata]|uniref:uncharacterized protein LOC143275410 n=1 Tax=Babylonia areolata TaxID=304850 RepID=UPI003FD2CCF0
MSANSVSINVTSSDAYDRDDCITLGWNATIPWDNPHNLISVETEIMIDKIKSGVLIPILYLIGAPANIISMVVFFKQGLKERINVCLFSLSLVDVVYQTIVLILNGERIHSLITNGEKFGAVYMYMINNNVIGLYGFWYGSTFISAVISTERCVCVLFPLRAQRCIPTKVLAAMIAIIVFVIGFLRFAVTAKYRAACFYEERTGRRSWQLSASEYYFKNMEMLNILDGIVYGICISVGCPVVVLITTVITSIRLRQIIRWRSQASSQMSTKEIGVTKMLICLSVEFLILSAPVIVLRLLPMFDPQLTAGGLYANMFLIFIGIGELSSYASSCVNFFVYYVTGSRYRETLHTLLGWKRSSELTNAPYEK